HEEVPWTHGISLSRDEQRTDFNMVAKIYLPGLPKKAHVEVNTEPPIIDFRLVLEDYTPAYDWLYLDVSGIQGRSAKMSISGIPSPIDLNISARMEIEMGRGGGVVKGTINASLTSQGQPVSAGALHMIGSQESPTWTQMELLIPKIPSEMGLNIGVENEASFEYSASEPLEYVYAKVLRNVGGRIASMYAMMSDIPVMMKASIIPRSNLDIDGSMLQMMPDIQFSASASTLDMFIQADGEIMGQRGNFILHIQNMSDYFRATLDGDTYKIFGGGVDYIEIIARGVPYSKQFTVDTLVIRVENLRGIHLKVDPLFGFYPIIAITNFGTGNVDIIVRAAALGSSWEVNAVLVNLAFREGALGDMPGHPNFMVNGGNLPLQDSPRQIMLVDPGLTLLLTFLLGGWV
ncbi:MAG: hypothetical protein QCI38_08965, partial [Candidatus Thermoplasmatota archaeon]|nr:hypothetical protein [Candidatus Thermoplasmatota archaeon]